MKQFILFFWLLLILIIVSFGCEDNGPNVTTVVHNSGNFSVTLSEDASSNTASYIRITRGSLRDNQVSFSLTPIDPRNFTLDATPDVTAGYYYIAFKKGAFKDTSGNSSESCYFEIEVP